MPKKAIKKPKWMTTAMFAAKVKRDDGRQLMLAVQAVNDRWTLLALEIGDAETEDDVFNDHAHKSLGNSDSIPEVFAVAESYAVAWQKHDAEARCKCKEINR